MVIDLSEYLKPRYTWITRWQVTDRRTLRAMATFDHRDHAERFAAACGGDKECSIHAVRGSRKWWAADEPAIDYIGSPDNGPEAA